MARMIEISNIEKSFGRLEVLKGVDLKLDSGKTYAFMGPNGSGKTTLLKCILGLVKPDEGEILIDGEKANNGWQYRNHIGYMPQIANFPENLKVIELFNMIRNIRKRQVDIGHLLHYFELETSQDKKLKNLSGGMKQKVNAILTLMFDPKLLILDEPSVGLDPISHIKLKDIIRHERDKGKTVLITTHIINDVEELADEIVFLMDGKIYFQGTPDTLRLEQEEEALDKAIARLTNKDAFDTLNSNNIVEYGSFNR